MEINYGLTDSAYKHVKYKEVSDLVWDQRNFEMSLAKGEKFAFQLLLKSKEQIYCSLDINNNVSWEGKSKKLRIGLDSDYSKKYIVNGIDLHFLGYVKNDDGLMIADPILNQKGKLLEKDISQSLWIEGEIPPDCNENIIEFNVMIWEQNAFEDEKLLASMPIKLFIYNFTTNIAKNNRFVLNLWQHPSNWARIYHVPLWSEDHWEIIKNYLSELATLGQKTITAIVSEFPWAGQECHKISSYPSNLFEHNMILVNKQKNGKLICDFSIIDRYIETCMDVGIRDDIELFGLLAVWEDDFGKPIKGYSDPIRIRYYDESNKIFKYIRKKEDLKAYIAQLFNHLIEKGWWNITKISADEPLAGDFDESVTIEMFFEWIKFINEINKDVKYRVVFTNGNHIEKLKGFINDWIPDLQTFINFRKTIMEEKNRVNKSGGKIYWYVCSTPDKPNNWLRSPLIENRLDGWFTYYFELDGFLRWDYAIWPHDPWNRPSYKFPEWIAGEMFFVYPGNNGKPIRSTRWENLRYGIQDYHLLIALEEKGQDGKKIRSEILQPLLGDLDEMESTRRITKMNYSLDYNRYEEARVLLLKELEE